MQGDIPMKITAYSNHNVAPSVSAESARECEVTIVPCAAALTHAAVAQTTVTIAKLTRRNVWLYNDNRDAPNWNAASGVKFAIIHSYSPTKAVRDAEEYQRRQMEYIKERQDREVEASRRMTERQWRDTKARTLAVAYGGGRPWAELIPDELEQHSPAATESDDTLEAFLQKKREPWRK
jgi:hypothetical protein